MAPGDFQYILQKTFKFLSKGIGFLYPFLFTGGKTCLQEKRVFFHDSAEEKVGFYRKNNIVIHCFLSLSSLDFLIVYEGTRGNVMQAVSTWNESGAAEHDI